MLIMNDTDQQTPTNDLDTPNSPAEVFGSSPQPIPATPVIPSPKKWSVKKKLIVILSLVLGAGLLLVIIISSLFAGGVYFGLSSTCGDGWQQRRLDTVLTSQKDVINQTNQILTSTSIPGLVATVERSDNKASGGDCLTAHGASVGFSKTGQIDGTVEYVAKQVEESLLSQGYIISPNSPQQWVVKRVCFKDPDTSKEAPSAYMQAQVSMNMLKDGINVLVSINYELDDCTGTPLASASGSSHEEQWNYVKSLPASSAELLSIVQSDGSYTQPLSIAD